MKMKLLLLLSQLVTTFCLLGSTDSVSSAAVPDTRIIKTCTGPGKLEAPLCYQYNECVKFLFFWWKPELRTCPEGQMFTYTEEVKACVKLESSCERPVSPPNCVGPGNYPAPLPYQYYQCERMFWWWRPILRTCKEGLSFNSTIGLCTA